MAKCCAMKRRRRKRRKLLLPSLTFFIGLTVGFLMSPVKYGVGNNNGNINNHYYGPDETDDELTIQ